MQKALNTSLERVNTNLALVFFILVLCLGLLAQLMTASHWQRLRVLMPPMSKPMWTFRVQSGARIEGKAEVRVRPQWDQVDTFDAFPFEFAISTFDPSAERLVIQWPIGEPAHRFCVDVMRGDIIIAANPHGQLFIGATVLNAFNACEIVMVRAP